MVSPRDDSPPLLTSMTDIGAAYQSVLDSVITKNIAPKKVESENSTTRRSVLYPPPKSKTANGSSYYRTLSFEASPRWSLHETSGDTNPFPAATAKHMAAMQDGTTCAHEYCCNICTCTVFLLHRKFTAMAHNASAVQKRHSCCTGPHYCREVPRY